MNSIFVTFESIHDTIEFESKFKNKLNFKIVPIPREISKSCGICIKIENSNINTLKNFFKKYNIKYKKIHITSTNV